MFDVVRKTWFLALGLVLAAGASRAQVAPAPDRLHDLVVAPAGYVATPAPVALERLAKQVDPALLADAEAFRAQAGPWRFFVDRRSAAVALAEGRGVEWLAPGATGDLASLERRARAFVAAHPALLPFADRDLVLDRAASKRFGEQGQYWNLAFRQSLDGVPVDGSMLVFRLSQGKLVQFGANRLLPQRARSAVAGVTPRLTAADARATLANYLGGLEAGDAVTEPGTLLWVLRGADDTVGYDGLLGGGWTPELVYRTTLVRAGSTGSWRALVDARSGAITRFTDTTDYASVLKASVYPKVNCSDPSQCVPGDVAEVPVTLPYAGLNFVGASCTGDACYTNSAGGFDYPAGAVSATTSLSGKYFTLVDGCGALAASAVAPGDLDLGTTDPNALGLNTDCQAATRESEPGTGPLAAGTGDTHAARNAYYHLSLINQKSRFYLPGNEWLKGADGAAGATPLLTNVAPVCNAFWQGTVGSLNFFKQVIPQFCNNTGELSGVFLHEFGHGLDQNDGTGTAPESATGEAMGDTFALLQTLSSCIGQGFLLPDPTNPNWGNTAGYGSRSRLCSGVRDIDYTRSCRYSNALPIPPDGCVAPSDPDEGNGARSGATPPPEPAGDAGTPARWNHMLASAPAGVADGLSNFYNCGGPETTGCAGPLNHGCHCESAIASQSNWDLARLLVSQGFGGSVYADPQGPAEHAGWQTMDRLWYLSRDLAVSGYSVTGPEPTGTTNGCTVTDWYSTYRFVDDDNGDLADGTPHADLIFQAFDLHGTACGADSDPGNQASGCGAVAAAPTLATLCGTAPVQLAWNAAAGAGSYRVLRNTLGCGSGFTPLTELGGDRLYFEDTEVAPGVSYFYSVQSVGANPSCFGEVSNCVELVPVECSAVQLPAPANPVAAASADNEITVSWDSVPQALSYKVTRKAGACDSTEPETAIGVVAAPITQYVDQDGIVGGYTYSYRVSASDTECPSCTGEPSVCVEATATGSCFLTPQFAGAHVVTSAANGYCGMNVSWLEGTSRCGGALSYDVYRSTDPAFTPAPENLVATGLGGTSYFDFTVVPDTRYFYAVRAKDGLGNAEANLVRRYEVATGVLTPGSFFDDAGDTAAATLFPAFDKPGTWATRDSDTGNATRVYATTPTGNYPDGACAALETPSLHLGAAPTLSFDSRYAIELGWDGGIVQIATEAGGFDDWALLSTVNYPGLLTGPLPEPACHIPEFGELAPVFTGNSNGYSTFTGALTDFAGQAVRLRFLFSSDTNTNDEGWFLDDIGVDDALLPATCTAILPPLGVDDAFQLPATPPAFELDVLANDEDRSGSGLHIAAVTQPARGTVTILSDPAGDLLVFTRDASGCPGSAVFTYDVQDGFGQTATAQVVVDLASDLPFLDGFESGDAAAWCSVMP